MSECSVSEVQLYFGWQNPLATVPQMVSECLVSEI